MSTVKRPWHAMAEGANKGLWLFQKRWLRNLILLPATLSGKRSYNKTEDYGVFRDNKCILENTEQCSYIVRDIEDSRKWFEDFGFIHSRTCDTEPHPTKDGHTLKCCYMSTIEHEECIVLMEHRDENGHLIEPTIHDIFHVAYELKGNQLKDTFQYMKEMKTRGSEPYYGPAKHNNSKPHGDGESGGNVAVYYFTPDYHHIEFCSDMDTIDNYEGRYGTGVRSVENDDYLKDNR